MQEYSTFVIESHWIMSFNTVAPVNWLKDKKLQVILNKTIHIYGMDSTEPDYVLMVFANLLFTSVQN